MNGLLYEQAQRSCEGERHRHKDARQAGSETLDYRLDTDEEERMLRSEISQAGGLGHAEKGSMSCEV